MESEKGKKSGKDETKLHSLEDWGGYTHRDQHIGLFTGDAMTQCLAKIKEVEAAQTGSQTKFSQNQVTQ